MRKPVGIAFVLICAASGTMLVAQPYGLGDGWTPGSAR